MTAWRWRAFFIFGIIAATLSDRSIDLFPRIVYSGHSFALFLLLPPFVGLNATPVFWEWIRLDEPISRHVRYFTLDNLRREGALYLCIYMITGM